jgi:hypothetical protein
MNTINENAVYEVFNDVFRVLTIPDKLTRLSIC